ncbi:glycosyltransferase family 87 protein [Arthrobacter sp. SDTb3-6]|uniref:glycosyltransferase family 87 protein n=1 Tax=Arthrobacter sp. SDTb3-6 TaxID=2713571 RepID=UPI00159E28E7|nr:glycosyltransferase family 87 protein [Arthrobacter sp. SDTb3-6]NVN00084.1 DUF2029 domain-containing protein [Arthrobacter sp. SDTb3-6]
MYSSKDSDMGLPRPGWGPAGVFARDFPMVARSALILVWPLALVAVFVSVRHLVTGNPIGQDSHAYWLAAHGNLSYGEAPGQRDAYLYSPAFAAAIKPFALLPWPLFCAAWFGIESAVVVWLVRPLRARWAIPVAMLCIPELVVGNIYILLAATAVIGMRMPAAWSFAILTKVTTGVGLLWFAARGDWKHVIQGAGATLLIFAIFYTVDPTAWSAWAKFLLLNRNGTPDSGIGFMARSIVAVVLVVVGARKQWAFLVAPAMVLASPVLVSFVPWTILAAIPRLLLERPAPSRSARVHARKG